MSPARDLANVYPARLLFLSLLASRLLPATLVPLASGIALLWLVDGAWAAYAFMTLLGVTMGMSGAVHAALWAELYGTRHLGAIQAMLGSLMVASTAASPAVVGLVLETGRGLDGLLLAGIVSVVVGAMLALRVVRADGHAPAGGGTGCCP